MLSENQSSSDNAEGSGTLIHHEQSEETLNLDDVGSTEMNKLHDPQQPSQSESTTNAEPDTIKGGLFKGIKTFFVKEVEEVSNVPSVKVTFHVHLPSFEYVEGYPVIVGNIEELGNWVEPIVKLKQLKSEREYMHSNHSHWYSDPISIQNDRFENEVRYRYAFFVPKPKPEEKSKGIASMFKKGDKSKDDEKDKGEPADKKKKGKDSEKDKGETAGIKKKGKDGENDKIESTSKDDKKNKTESNSRDGGNDDLENEAAYTQADNASTTDDPTAQEVHDNIEDQKNKETKADKKNRDTRNKEEGDLYVEVEGESPRILGMRNGFQFDVVGRFKVKNRSCQLTTIRDFAFLNLVYNTITSTNLKEKISEYQDLLNRFERFTLHASQIEFIESNLLKTKPKEYEKRIFLCLVLGRYLDWRQQESLGRLKLPKNRFPLAQIIDTLENFQPDTFPEEYYLFLSITMTAVIQLNVDNRSFDWLKLFEIASIIDPSFTFIEAIQDLRYNNIDDLVKNFLKEFIKHAKPVVNQIKDLKIYSNIGRWLFSNCNSFETLLFVWTDVIDHTKDRDIHLLRHFRPRVEQLVSLPRATLLAKQFSLIPAELCVEVAVIFKVKALLLLKNRSIEWDKKNSEAILQILKDSQLNWSKEEFLEAMDYVSESSKHYLLVTFPSLLSYWFDSKFKTLITNKLPEICRNWYYHLIERINGSDLRDSNDSKFIYAIYKNLSDIFPIVGKYAKIFNDMLEVTVNHVRNCAVSDILSVTPNIATLEKEISVSYGGMVKAMLWKSVHKIDNNLIKILLQVCGCDNEILDIPSALSEDIVCSVMTNLEAKDDIVNNQTKLSTTILNLLKTFRFWRLIFNATGRVEKLYSHPYVKQVQRYIYDFAKIINGEEITIRSLNEILKYDTDTLHQFFNFSMNNKEIISKDLIKKHRKDCHGYLLKMDQLRTFYDRFCPIDKVKDVQKFLDDINNRNNNLEYLALKVALSDNHWGVHKKNMNSSRRAHRIANSCTFRNIFDIRMKSEEVDLTVENVAQILMPAVFEQYDQLCRQYKEWEKLKCSEGSDLWKNVKNVEKELSMMDIQTEKTQILINTLAYLASVPTQIERLQQLTTVVIMFKVTHTQNDWLGRLQLILRGDYLWLGRLVSFFEFFNQHLGSIEKDCWDLIRELSLAGEFIVFLQKIAEHDIKNLINGVDESSDERLIQEDTVSSLIQVKQFLLPLLKSAEKLSLDEFLDKINSITLQSSKLGNKVALCNSHNMALQNLYNSIQNKGEVTKEKIRNAVRKGTYTFERDYKGDTCKVTLSYPVVAGLVKYTLTDLHDLRGRALLISKPSAPVDIGSSNAPWAGEEEISKPIMDKFVTQVDMAQEIINFATKLIQTGHFHYRAFNRKLSGVEKMQQTVLNLKEDLKEWEKIVNAAQEDYYYLTFYPARHILTFLDYFSVGEKSNDNIEECEKLIRFVNSKAKLPPKDKVTINLNKNYEQILGEIGTNLREIFGKVPKETNKVRIIKERVVSDIVYPGKLFVAACDDKTLVPNIIMSLYANHGYYPLPWQTLICTISTTMEELASFVKRCFFAHNNGYTGNLFCLANLELLDFELQFNLVNLIKSMRKRHEQFQLALICYREPDVHHHILDQFSQDVHATNGLSGEAMKMIYRELCPKAMTVSSDLSGQGKTERIKQYSFSNRLIPSSFLISDKVNFGTLVHKFKEFKMRSFECLHLNIVSANEAEDANTINMFLFELITLGIVFSNMDVAILPNTFIYIEVASTMGQRLFESIPMVGYLTHIPLTWDIRDLVVSQEISSPIQVVCHYLKALSEQAAINERDIYFKTGEGSSDLKPLPDNVCRKLIEDYLFIKNKKGANETKDILSFRFIEIFVNVFADQLVRLSSSSYFRVENLKLMVEEQKIRSTLVQTLLSVSKDFATKSIATKRAQKGNISIKENDILDVNALLGTIEQWDDSNHLLVFFLSQTPDSICALYRDRSRVPQNVKTLLKSQYIGDKDSWDLDDYHTKDPKHLLSILENLARKTMHKIVYPPYALSADNLIKMALILLRARASIPVIVCGEAGCGKTSLIGYLSKVVEVEFHALNLHAGISEEVILKFMKDSQEKVEEGEVWLFFDEINTCNHIGLLADLIAHRMLNGKPIHCNIRLFAACNPYRMRTKAATTAGLLKPTDVRFEETSKLVYQVHPLPDQILDYVWDYGTLKPIEERKYIEIMVQEQLKELGHLVFSDCLFESQEFIRKCEESYSVSLRDVKRAITLVKFFKKSFEGRPPIKKYDQKPKKYPQPSDISINVRSCVLALGLCYQSRLYEQKLRTDYRKKMGEVFKKHKININEDRFSKILREEQDDYVDRMQCPPNTAKNEALLENVLVMIVCILTKIPCFIIGAPGSSKSLAVRLISQNLRGSDSNDEYFRKLPQVYLIPHQGSSSSTSEGIIKVFDKAVNFQDTSSEEFPVISVVLLDEVGLAEKSPFNPLKVLHSLLEPSYPDTEPKVSCVAISNWRLDNSKSSRALLVQRPKFELVDLTDTAKRLLIKSENSQITEASLLLLARSYLSYELKGQKKLPNFHGLRDYYSLVKSLSQNNSLTPENIQMALIRNFGGADNIKELVEDYFGTVMRYFNSSKEYQYKSIPIWQLIDANLEDKDARHLMVIGKSDSIVNLLNYQLRKENLDPVIILGSQFPEDQDDYSYSVLNRIMMCVETGKPLILTDLEIIYGSLYDLWNQNYIVVGSEDDPKFYTRVALGAYANPMLYVAPTFRCILVMDENKLEKADPPLLNRFEKQRMVMSDTLTSQENELVEALKEWTELISTITDNNFNINFNLRKFKQKDLFIGFDENETLQSLVIDIKKSFPDDDDEEVLFKCKEKLIKIASSDGMIRAERSRLGAGKVKQWKNIYFNQQHHDSLIDHIQYRLYKFHEESVFDDENMGLQIIVNTFSNINTDVKSCLQYVVDCQVDKLSTFKTESQFQNRIKSFWMESQDAMLILQCDVTIVSAGCIKLAKFLVEQYRNEYLQKKKRQLQLLQQKNSSTSNGKQSQEVLPVKHACIILHIHREQENSMASFNFMCGWDQVTIESLLPQEKKLSLLLNDSLSDLITSTYPFEEILKQELLWCLLCIKYPSNVKSVQHIKMLNEKIFENQILIDLLKVRTIEWLEQYPKNTNWQYEIASNKKLLYPYSSFVNALLTRIRSIVRQPIAKLLYALEKYSAIYTIILLYERSLCAKGPASEEDIPEEIMANDDVYLLEFWHKMVNDENMISIENTKEPSPDGYTMSHGIYELEFPFSSYIMKKIDDSKRIYEEELASLHNDKENVDQTTGELYSHVVEDYNKKFISNIEKSPIIKNSPIANFPNKYFKDFINVILTNEANNINEKMEKGIEEKLLKFIFERRLGVENVLNPIRLHSYWWKNSSSILAELALAKMIPDIIIQIEKENDDNLLSDVDFEKYLVEQVIQDLLYWITTTKDRERLKNRFILEKWQYEVTKVLSLCEKINVSSKLYSLQLLRICNDILINKSIPLENIKQIIKYAQQQRIASDIEFQDDLISKEFINIVISTFDKFEPTERNLIPRRLFVLRSLDMLTLESPIRLHFYKILFSSSPFPLMGAIILRIFKIEEKEYPNIILQLVTQPKQTLQYSGRLYIINQCFDINRLSTMMSTLVCDVLQQGFFSKLDLNTLSNGFNSAINSLYGNDVEPLQRIASIAFLKEFTSRFWNFLIKRKDDSLQPITYNLLDAKDFDGTTMVEQLNLILTKAHPLIHAFKLYLLRELRINREFSSDDIKKFCDAQSKNLNWFNNFDANNKDDNRLPFNPYWAIPDYGKLELAFTLLYHSNNKTSFNQIFQQLNDKIPNLSNKLLLIGIVMTKLHSIRASREWNQNERDISQYFSQQLVNLTTIPEKVKATILNVLTNTQSLLRINQGISNDELLMKSVLTHIIGLHILLEPQSTPLSMYMHRIGDSQNTFVLTCQSDIESMVLSAIAESDIVSRYACQCGYKYLIGECGQAWIESKCPECKKKIGGSKHVAASGNTRIDAISQNKFESKDQRGYISESPDKDINHTTRNMPPVSYRILHLIVHAIIGSQAPSPPVNAFIQQHNKNYTNVENYCMEHIKNDWNILKTILNCSCENLALTFHSIILNLTTNPPQYNSTLHTSNDRDQWEKMFTQTCVLPFTRSVNESSTKFRAQLDQNMKKADVRNSLLEEEINQSNTMDDKYLNENLPALWRIIGRIDYDSFRAYYISDPNHFHKYPFLKVFFKHSKDLPLIQYLYHMVKFIQLLSNRLGYKLSREEAKTLTFEEFIKKTSNGDTDTYNSLCKSFVEFRDAYNTIIYKIKRYQCHDIPKEKPQISFKESVVYGLMEGKDEGIYLCAILEFLINIQNKFLEGMMSIPPGSCGSLKFLQSPSWDDLDSSSIDNAPYIVKTMKLERAIESNFIFYEWNDEILQYSQRNLGVGKGQDIIYDLQRIESELANTLVHNKAYFEGVGNEQLILDPFPYHLELFSSSMRLLGEIKSLIPQETIPSEKISLIIGQQAISSHLTLSKDNSSELLSLLEILLCFVNRSFIGDGELLLSEFIDQWIQLSSLSENPRFKNILCYELKLKHIVSLYEIIEEQVADIMIQYVDRKFKDDLTDRMKEDLNNVIDFDGVNKGKIPADSFIIAMKRFIQRILQAESEKETHRLVDYMIDMSLNLWPSNNDIEEVLNQLFPQNLLVSNSLAAYEYVLQKKKSMGNKPIAINTFNSQTIASSSLDIKSSPSRSIHSSRKGKKVDRSKFDAM